MNKIKTSLFLDRDGVINRRLPGRYIQHYGDFEFLPGAKEAIGFLRKRFHYLFIVTNQQGIGKGLMTEGDLAHVHQQMKMELEEYGVSFNGIYYCPERAEKKDNCRKPNLQMAHWAKRDYPEVRFKHSVMMGDSAADMVFGKKLQMTTVWIQSEPEREQAMESHWYNFKFESLEKAVQDIEEIELEMWT
jgi:histidinol-phosphate phosphatase family protein